MRGILKWPWCFTGSIQQILFQLILLTTCLCSGSNSNIFRDDQTTISKVRGIYYYGGFHHGN